ncbi:MAG TPA: hypothetical protein VIC29_03975 [Steroidobacteraceae bacterium]|jgi:hypothetical protein
MIRSRNKPQGFARPRAGAHRRRKLLSLTRARLISNLLALVALFSIGFV